MGVSRNFGTVIMDNERRAPARGTAWEGRRISVVCIGVGAINMGEAFRAALTCGLVGLDERVCDGL